MAIKKLFVLLLASIVVSCDRKASENQNLFSYVPQNTIAVIQVNDFNIAKNALNNQPLLKGLTQLRQNFKLTIETITPDNIEVPALYCFTPIGKSETVVSIIYKTSSSDSVSVNAPKKIKYNGVDIEVIQSEQLTYYKAKISAINYVSNSQLIVENSIRNIQNHKKGIQVSDFYLLADNIDDNSSMNIFIHPDIKHFMETVAPDTPLYPAVGTSWAAYDFSAKRDPFTLNGISFINDSILNTSFLIKDMTPHELISPRVIPNSFTSFLSMTVSNMKTLESNFKKYSRFHNIPLTQIDFDPYSAVDEIAWVQKDSTVAVFFHLNNIEVINEKLLPTTDKQKHKSTPYYRANLPKDISIFLAQYTKNIDLNWVVRIEDFLVFAEDEKDIKAIIDSYKNGNVLENDVNFQTLKGDLADNYSLLWIGQSKALGKYWNSLSNKKSRVNWKAVPNETYPLFAMQTVGEDNFMHLYLTAQINNPKHTKGTVKNQFQFALDAPLATPPQWLKNHRNRTMDVVVQDINNVLYLFSNSGALYWKKQLPGKIIGRIQQVDLYKNNRLQMAFRTENRFMILDRNGKIVPPFDIKTDRGDTTLPLSVFDYDLNRNYRFLINRGTKLTLYDSRGKIVKGFKLKRLNAPLIQAPKHIRIGNKDYIIFQQKDGNLKIVNRRGVDRVKPKEKINFSGNSVYSYLNTFTTTDTDGNLVQVDSKGNVLRSPLNLALGHQIDMTVKSLATLSENILTIKGIPVELPHGNYTAPKIFYLNDTLYFSTTDLDSQKVYLYYSNGLPVEGFPVYGKSTADLSNADGDRDLELIVQGEDDGLLIYQVNENQ